MSKQRIIELEIQLSDKNQPEMAKQGNSMFSEASVIR